MADTIHQLEQEIALLKEREQGFIQMFREKDVQVIELRLQLTKALGQLAEMQTDAERYRYIRDAETLNQVIWDALEGIGSDEPEGYRRGMDRAVDAAIAAQAQGGGNG